MSLYNRINFAHKLKNIHENHKNLIGVIFIYQSLSNTQSSKTIIAPVKQNRKLLSLSKGDELNTLFF